MNERFHKAYVTPLRNNASAGHRLNATSNRIVSQSSGFHASKIFRIESYTPFKALESQTEWM